MEVSFFCPCGAAGLGRTTDGGDEEGDAARHAGFAKQTTHT
jgi:hypothetical protein